MNPTALDILLTESFTNRERSWAKILSQLKRQFDNWACSQFNAIGYTDFKMGYMPLLMNILPQGITNNELAKNARVSKQAMSKVVKELLALQLISTETDEQDKRSAIIMLTDKGKEFVIMVRKKVAEIEVRYEEAIGKTEFEHLKDNLLKIIAVNDELMKKHCS